MPLTEYDEKLHMKTLYEQGKEALYIDNRGRPKRYTTSPEIPPQIKTIERQVSITLVILPYFFAPMFCPEKVIVD